MPANTEVAAIAGGRELKGRGLWNGLSGQACLLGDVNEVGSVAKTKTSDVGTTWDACLQLADNNPELKVIRFRNSARRARADRRR